MEKVTYLVLFILVFLSPRSEAREFEVFDGRFYNGLYYPKVDIIEWGEQNGELPHLEFHFHSKDKPMDLAVVIDDKRLWLMYDLKFRGERICRFVVAPSHFRAGMSFYTYRDNASDSDYDNIYVSTEKMKGKNLIDYKMPEYVPCQDENAANKPSAQGRLPASTQKSVSPSDPPKFNSPSNNKEEDSINLPLGEPKKGKGVGIDYDNHAMPFSF